LVKTQMVNCIYLQKLTGKCIRLLVPGIRFIAGYRLITGQ
jgi:hypothetical protein